MILGGGGTLVFGTWGWGGGMLYRYLHEYVTMIGCIS